ncbi:hypothetical protein HYPSUDRAFT_641418 [Hypholoma sublateritium FD-334 SS-4]|uniref:Uncharacterized protein n=1 Tax=Hypholoma sublateritium (strain FD-334 SS-4) TaxID=945553 RepID=A0A0D2MGS9_HYPSF|nr:hypothetical protein HYPSUDRAFT_641418 [Hypholoma sublateritium FD-334 SS-4]
MRLQHVMSLSVIAAGTLVSASDSHLPLVGAASLPLAIAERTASALIPFTLVGVVLLSSTPVSACVPRGDDFGLGGGD